MRPNRIVIVNDQSKALGGATALALLSARGFAAAQHEVVYVTGDSGEHVELPANVEVIALNGKPLLEMSLAERMAKGLYNREAHDFVQRAVRQFDGPGTVFHLHGWAQIFSPSVLAALAPVQDRLLIHAHDFFHACPNGTFFDFEKGTVCNRKPLGVSCLSTACDKRNSAHKAFRVSRFLLKQRLLDLRNTRALIAIIHPYMADWLARAAIDPGRLRVARNPVTPFRSERVEAERNSEMVFIGRVELEKGVDLAIEAAHGAGRKIRVIGDGAERQRLAALYPDVIWDGWSSHERIAELVTRARALIMPSRLPEPFGLVALEALQSGIPLVAFPDSFVASEAAQLGCAFLAKDRQAGSLTDAVRMLDDDMTVKKASETAFAQTRALSSTRESWLERLMELYGELLTEARSPQVSFPQSFRIETASSATLP